VPAGQVKAPPASCCPERSCRDDPPPLVGGDPRGVIQKERSDYRSISNNVSLGIPVWLEMSLRSVFRVFALISLCRGTVTGLVPVLHCLPIRTRAPRLPKKGIPDRFEHSDHLIPANNWLFDNNINLVLEPDNRHARCRFCQRFGRGDQFPLSISSSK